MDAVLVKFPSVDFSVVVGVHFAEEIIKAFLHHLFVEEAMLFKFISDPTFKLSLFEDVAAVAVMLKEDVLNKFFTIRIHLNLYNQ